MYNSVYISFIQLNLTVSSTYVFAHIYKRLLMLSIRHSCHVPVCDGILSVKVLSRVSAFHSV